jgi:streptogramin lyase
MNERNTEEHEEYRRLLQHRRTCREDGLETAMMNTKQNENGIPLRAGVAIGMCAIALTLTGCGVGGSSSSATVGAAPLQVHGGISGNVHGGQQPVTSAKIQLYAVGSSGLASAATPLIPAADQVVYNPAATAGTTGALTDSNGNFLITGDYTCPTPSPQVYLVATGGNSGSGANGAIALMAPLGDCAALVQNASLTYVQINELTTIASAYALAPFMSGYANVGAPTVNAPGLINAVANFNALVSLTTGAAGGASLPTGAVVPTTEINTLGNIIAACVNTAGSTSGPCATLFGATGGSDTVAAALAFAKSPGSAALTALYTLSASAPPLQQSNSAAPNDWTIAIKYAASGTLSSPTGIAIDAAGNAWVTNGSGNASYGLVKLTSTGNLVNNYSGGGLIGAKGLAIDKSGNIWVANAPTNSVIEFNSAGVVQSGTNGFTGGGLNGPSALAIDSGGNVWVANLNGSSVTELNSSGSPTSANGSTGFTASNSISLPSGIAIDSTGNVWIANYGNSNVVKLTNSGTVASGSPFSDQALQGPSAIAVDTGGNAWVPGAVTGASVAGAVSEFSNAGVAVSASPFTGGGLLYASAVAISGTTAWVVNKRTGSGLTEIVSGQTAPSSPSAGFGSLSSPSAVAVDPSGDVWTANSGDNTVSEFIGITAPVVTPIAAAHVGP